MVPVILVTTRKEKNRKMNYTTDSLYRGLGTMDGIPHRVIADCGSKQGLCCAHRLMAPLAFLSLLEVALIYRCEPLASDGLCSFVDVDCVDRQFDITATTPQQVSHTGFAVTLSTSRSCPFSVITALAR